MTAMFRSLLLSVGIFFHDLGVAIMALGFKAPKTNRPSMRPPAETLPDEPSTIPEMQAAPKRWN